jgi:alkylation response protein AidB-like acyl-CoA dehydrogenase
MSHDLAPYLDEAQLHWRETVHRFLEQHATPDYVRACDEEKRFPEELVDAAAEQGWFAVTLPEAYGGVGGYLEMTALVEMAAYHSTALARFWNVNVNMVGGAIAAFGSEELKARILPELALGRVRLAFALSENGAGSDAAALRTKGVIQGERMIIDGTKMWITGAQVADYIMTAVRTDPSASRHEGISLILVPRDAPGLRVTPIDLLGGHAIRTCEVDYRGVEVPLDLVVGELHGGWKRLMRVLAKERVSLAAMCAGAAQAAVDVARDYATQREQFGSRISRFQAVSHKLVDMQIATDAARLMAYRAARLLADGYDAGAASSAAKVFASDAYVRIATESIQVMGANGYAMEYPMQRHFREAKLFQLFGGTNEIQRNVIAREMRL